MYMKWTFIFLIYIVWELWTWFLSGGTQKENSGRRKVLKTLGSTGTMLLIHKPIPNLSYFLILAGIGEAN